MSRSSGPSAFRSTARTQGSWPPRPAWSRSCFSRTSSTSTSGVRSRRSSATTAWDETQRDPVDIALRCQEAGAQALTLHPRTRTQMYHGAANWNEIAAVAAALTIPVIGNGDIRTPADVLAMRQQTNCAGVMIARGSFGNPWLFAQARDLLAGRAMRPDPSPADRFSTALEHARLALRLQGDTRKTALEFRKHFGWYTKGLPGASELRQRLFAIESMAEAEAIFSDYLFGSVRSAA
ncbi:MAG: hypothetical protein DMD58_06415 [Gemmatimonadetes bacterium]|nr:MAG: hypothetical protein DMD58_06415 [Gemmatimonadota bacterium]